MSIHDFKSRKLGSLQEVTVSNFFCKTNRKSPFWHQVGINKKPKKKSLKKQ